MKKILITGTTGMLGSSLVRLFQSNHKYKVYGLGRGISNFLPREDQILVDLSKPIVNEGLEFVPDVIVHTAALTDLNQCERDPQLARQVHVEGTKTIAKMGGRQTKFIYISTDSVFDGESGNYTEKDIPRPLNEYANSKLAGELASKETAEGEVIVIRTNIYGYHIPLGNSLAEWAYREWGLGKSINGFTDVTFNAVFTNQLSIIIEKMIDKNISFPILNIGSNESVSKFDFLNLLRQNLGVDKSLLLPSLSSEYSSSIQRPKNTSLNTTLLSTFESVPRTTSGLSDWTNEIHEQSQHLRKQS